MERINNQFGPFYQDEIDFYIQQLSVNGEFIMNSKQKEWVLYIFYKYFGDPAATKAINRNDYIKLIIASKKILESSELYLLPRILSSKFSRLNTRKSVNKTDSKKIESSQFFKLLQNKYLDPNFQGEIITGGGGDKPEKIVLTKEDQKRKDKEKKNKGGCCK